jgi:hypothetical protein
MEGAFGMPYEPTPINDETIERVKQLVMQVIEEEMPPPPFPQITKVTDFKGDRKMRTIEFTAHVVMPPMVTVTLTKEDSDKLLADLEVDTDGNLIFKGADT